MRYSIFSSMDKYDLKRLEPITPLDNLLLERMCIEAVEGVCLQCGREYREDDTDDVSETQLHKLSEDDRKNIPTDNLACERSLSRFGNLASLSAAKSKE